MKVVVNGVVVGLLREWSAFTVTIADPAVGGAVRISLLLLNPVGECPLF